jgi:membrane-anchored protein YejM (alkaline phosphatase superfamily)
MTEKKFLSVKEASLLSGKSESTLKRFILKEYKTGKSKKDQTLNQKIKKEKAPKGFFWFIAEDFLKESFDTPKEKESLENTTIQILHEQLKTKDEQIKSLLERQRENNILMKGLQEKVFVLESGTPEEVFSEEKTAEFSEETKDEETQSETSKAPQKGFWGRIFS